MTGWLSVSLRDDAKRLCDKVRFASKTFADDKERRLQVIAVGSTLPGLRMCERRRIIFIAQSAPPIELATLHERLTQLNKSFEEVWEKITHVQEQIYSSCRSNLLKLDNFVNQLNKIYSRRDESARLLDELENRVIAPSVYSTEPIYAYIGFEVDVLLKALERVKYPEALMKRNKRNRMFDTLF